MGSNPPSLGMHECAKATKPPYTGAVCPVVWEGRGRETFPSPDSAAGSRKKRPEGVLYGLEPSLSSLRRVRQHGTA